MLSLSRLQKIFISKLLLISSYAFGSKVEMELLDNDENQLHLEQGTGTCIITTRKSIDVYEGTGTCIYNLKGKKILDIVEMKKYLKSLDQEERETKLNELFNKLNEID